MVAFATYEDLEKALKVTFPAEDRGQATELLEAASSYLRFVIGQNVYPQDTVTFTGWPDLSGRVDLPQWPVASVGAVQQDGVDVEYRFRPGFVLVGDHEPVDVTFTYGTAEAPEELRRVTVVLAAQALQSLELTGSLTAGGLSSVSIDDFRAAFAEGGSSTGIALPKLQQDALRRAFGRGDVSIVEAYT